MFNLFEYYVSFCVDIWVGLVVFVNYLLCFGDLVDFISVWYCFDLVECSFIGGSIVICEYVVLGCEGGFGVDCLEIFWWFIFEVVV